MEAIRRIVQEIRFICRVRSVQVSDTLSAFMARAPSCWRMRPKFPLDKELNESDVQELIKMACERLCEEDSPPLETVKMQVALDAARLQEGEVLEEQQQERERKEGGLIAEISEMRLKAGNDVEALTSLYRKIFNFLVVRAGLEPGADRPAEREIAAALESRLPSDRPQGLHGAADGRQGRAAARAREHRARHPPLQPAYRQGRRRHRRPAHAGGRAGGGAT